MTPSSRRKSAYAAAALAAALLACELLARLAFAFVVPSWEKARLLMAGLAGPEAGYQYCIGQPYLLYIPSPGFTLDGEVQHNAQGYRGPAVPMRRRPGVARVLCLGGSTTYGWGVRSWKDSYPAHLERRLRERLPRGWRGVEVVNAGIPWGTTAEILTHYHFKFHYYRPDVVVINPGGNDAQGLDLPHFQPDNSHWRKPMLLPQPLTRAGRWLARSALLSAFMIPLLHGRDPGSESFVKTDGAPPPAPWYAPAKNAAVPDDEVPFKHNLEALVDEAARDGAKVVLLPFRAAPDNDYKRFGPALLRELAREERLLKRLAESRRAVYAPFPDSAIGAKNWVDDCHNNSEGNREKAAYVAPFVLRALQQAPLGASR